MALVSIPKAIRVIWTKCVRMTMMRADKPPQTHTHTHTYSVLYAHAHRHTLTSKH